MLHLHSGNVEFVKQKQVRLENAQKEKDKQEWKASFRWSPDSCRFPVQYAHASARKLFVFALWIGGNGAGFAQHHR